MANNVYFNNYYPLRNKEENILSFLLELVAENTAEDKLKIWDVLKKCISSENFKNLGFFDLTDSFKSEMVQHIINHLNTSQDLNLILIECSIILLQQHNFYAYFKNALKQYFDLLFTTLNLCLDIEKTKCDDFIFKLFTTMKDFWKELSVKIELIDIFINEGILPLISFFENYHIRNDEKSSKKLQEEVIKCLQHLIFSRNINRNIGLHLDSIFTEGAQPLPSDHLDERIFFFLSNEIYTNDKKSTYFLFTFIFRAFYSGNKTKEKEVFQFLVTLCTIIGFKPPVKVNEKYVFLLMPNVLKERCLKYKLKCCSNPKEISFNILREFFEILRPSNISFETQLNSISLMDWLESLLVDIYSTDDWDSSELAVSMIEVLSKFIEFNPLLVLSHTANILPVLIKQASRNKELKIPFEQCMHLLFQMSWKSHRMHKFLSFILDSLKEINLPKELDLVPEDILPESLLKDIEMYIPSLQTSYLRDLIRIFIHHLKTNYANVLISTTNLDDINILYIETICKLFCYYLGNLRITERSMTPYYLKQFKKHFLEIKIILNNIGDDLIKKEHNSRLMFTYLEMTYNYIEQSSLLIIPLNDCNFDSKEYSDDFDLFKKNALHKHWHLISERVTNFGLAKCKDMLHKLAIQKVNISVTPEHNSSFLESIVEGELSASLVLTHTQTLGNALEPPRLLKLTSHIIKQVSKGQGDKEGWNYLVQAPHVQDVRPFVHSLLSSSLLLLKKLFYTKSRSSDKGKKQNTRLQQIAFQVLNKVDSQLIVITDSKSLDLKPYISEMIEEMNRDWQSELKKEYVVNIEELENILKFMKQLPIAYVPNDLQVIIILSIFIIIWNLNLLEQSSPPELGEILLDIFFSPISKNLCSSISMLTLIKWCRQININLNEKTLKLLYQRLYELFFKSDNDVTTLKEVLPFISKHHLKNIKDEKNCREIGLFLLTLIKNIKHLSKGKDRDFYIKIADRLAEKIHPLSIASTTTSLSEPSCSLQAYVYLLKKNINNSSESIDIMDNALLKSNDFYLKLTLEQLSCENEENKLYYSYIQLLLGHFSKLQSFLPQSFIQDLWTLMGNKFNIEIARDLRTCILHFASDIDFTIIIENLIEITELTLKNPSQLEINLMLWHSVISSNLNMNKSKKRLKCFYNLTNNLFMIRRNWTALDENYCSCVLPTLEIFEATLENIQINPHFALMDSFFMLLCAVPYSLLKSNRRVTLISSMGDLIHRRVPQVLCGKREFALFHPSPLPDAI